LSADVSNPTRIAAVVLAAGMSRRMGTPKPLLPLGGRAMLLHVLDALARVEAIDRTVVVTGHGHDQIAAIAPEAVALVHNVQHTDGEMVSSVKVGISSLRGECDAIVLALGDQPLIRAETVRRLIDGWRSSRSRIVLPRHAGKRGHPIVLDSTAFDEILSLSPHETLKTYISRHAMATMEVDVNDPAIHFDVDTPEDYTRAEALLTTGGAQPGRRITSCPPTVESKSASGAA